MHMWWHFASDMFHANLEVQRVVSLRLMKLARGGPGAVQETRRMISEKFDTSAEATIALATGGTPDNVMKRYRGIVRANERRLRRRRR